MDNTERIPITPDTATSIPKIDIVTVMKPLDVHDFLPRVEYMLKGASISSEAKDLQSMLQAFIEENKELINNGEEFKNDTDMRLFTEGFRNALAIVNLWIDSLYITQLSAQEQ